MASCILLKKRRSRVFAGISAFYDAAAAKTSLDDAYHLLGVDKSVSDADLKKTYRRLMSQHHPDKLVAKGLPEQMIRDATEKTQQIKAAYELIRKSRD
jgi:DnaJ like chaperone protein